MASGCIIEKCYVCEDIIWEDDDYTFFLDRFIHSKCYGKAVREATGMTKKQYENLCRVPQLEQDIKDLKNMAQYYKDEIKRMESELSKIKSEV